MAIYIALMRGINVSGRHLIRMAELQNSFAALGFADVQTYLQSGNVVFRSGKSDATTLASVIENKVKQDFGHDVAVLVLTAGQLAAIVRARIVFQRQDGGFQSVVRIARLRRQLALSPALYEDRVAHLRERSISSVALRKGIALPLDALAAS